jgi:hypothetical protein
MKTMMTLPGSTSGSTLTETAGCGEDAVVAAPEPQDVAQGAMSRRASETSAPAPRDR